MQKQKRIRSLLSYGSTFTKIAEEPKIMDIFDSTLAIIAFFYLTFLCFWKKNDKPRIALLTMSDAYFFISMISLSVIHHWHDPHRRVYQWALFFITVVISIWNFLEGHQGRRKKMHKTQKKDN